MSEPCAGGREVTEARGWQHLSNDTVPSIERSPAPPLQSQWSYLGPDLCPSDKDVHLLFHLWVKPSLSEPRCCWERAPHHPETTGCPCALLSCDGRLAFHLLLPKQSSPGTDCHLAAEGMLACFHGTSTVAVTACSVYLFSCVRAPPPQLYPGTQCSSKPRGNRKFFSLGWLFDVVWPFLFLLKAFLLDASSFFPPFSSHSNFFPAFSRQCLQTLIFKLRD